MDGTIRRGNGDCINCRNRYNCELARDVATGGNTIPCPEPNYCVAGIGYILGS